MTEHVPEVVYTCHICGALILKEMCVSCGHEQCAECPVYVAAPTREELIERITTLTAENAALKVRNEEIYKDDLAVSKWKGERIRELEAQVDEYAAYLPASRAIAEENVSLRERVAQLSEPVSDEEWAEFQQISRSEGGVMQRFRINDLLAARKNAQEQP